jgi:hypothetical protein
MATQVGTGKTQAQEKEQRRGNCTEEKTTVVNLEPSQQVAGSR